MAQTEPYNMIEDLNGKLHKNITEYLTHEFMDDGGTLAFTFERYLLNNSYVTINPPHETKEKALSFVTVKSKNDITQGYSIKTKNIIRNITIDIKGFVFSIANLIISGCNLEKTEYGITKICMVLVLLKTLVSNITIEISREQVFILVALWKNCNAFYRIPVDGGLEAVNALLKKYGENPLEKIKYNKLLDSLEQIGCIELEDGEIFLKEKISRKYLDKVYYY